MIRRPPRSTQSRSSAASDVYKRQTHHISYSHGFPLSPNGTIEYPHSPSHSLTHTLLPFLALDIIFFWIPNHKGIQGNETVHSLGKNATNLPRINPRFSPSKSDLSAFIHQKITHHWVTTWQQQPSSNKLLQIKHLPFSCTADGTKSYSLASESVILDSPMHIFSPNSITASWITL